MLIAGGGGADAQPPPPPETPPPLVEAARQNRARVAASRERHGPAPRVTDADLTGRPLERPDIPAPAAPLEREALRNPDVTNEDLAREASGDVVEAVPDDVQTNVEARLREIDAREAEIQERLLDIAASLTAIGSSGLPYAQRRPNRFQSPLDAGRLRAEREDLQEELQALAAERRILR
jgi:hypothetical protein